MTTETCKKSGRAHTPITSEAERKLMATAKYNPSKVYKKNKSILGMSDEELTRHLHEAKSKKLPEHVRTEHVGKKK